MNFQFRTQLFSLILILLFFFSLYNSKILVIHSFDRDATNDEYLETFEAFQPKIESDEGVDTMAAYEVLIDHAGSSNFITFSEFIDWDSWSSFVERHAEFESLLRNHFWDDISASLWQTDHKYNSGNPLIINPNLDSGYVVAVYFSKNIDKIDKVDNYINNMEKEIIEKNKSYINQICHYKTLFQSTYQNLITYQLKDLHSVGKFLGHKIIENSFDEIKSKGYFVEWAFEIYKPIRHKHSSRSEFEKEDL